LVKSLTLFFNVFFTSNKFGTPIVILVLNRSVIIANRTIEYKNLKRKKPSRIRSRELALATNIYFFKI